MKLQKILTTIIVFAFLATTVLAATSISAEHTYTVASNQPDKLYKDKKTIHTGVFCLEEGTAQTRAFIEFNAHELQELDTSGGHVYLQIQISQLAENICQSRKDMEFLEVFTVADSGENFDWNSQPMVTSQPLDSRQVLSNSNYNLKIPTHILNSMMSQSNPKLLLKMAGDSDPGYVSAKEIRSNAKLVVRQTEILFDTDFDGLEDNIEIQLGTDPSASDSDGDSISDFVEVLMKLNPNKGVTHRDGIQDKDRVKSNACEYVRCPTGVPCEGGACLVPSLKESRFFKEYQKKVPPNPSSCIERGGYLCGPSEDCDGTWAPQVSDTCCFGLCMTSDKCLISSVDVSTEEVWQGDTIKIIAGGALCNGKSARVVIQEIDGIGSPDDSLYTPVPIVFKDGKVVFEWNAEWFNDGIFGGENEYKICVLVGGMKRCADKFVKVKKKIGKTCAAGDGCKAECDNGDPDCGCAELMPYMDAYVCSSQNQCPNPVMSAEGICCETPCIILENCGDGFCDSSENEEICPADCTVGEEKIFTLMFDGTLASTSGQQPSTATGAEFSYDAVSGQSLTGLADNEYVQYEAAGLFYPSRGTAAMWIKFDRFSTEDSTWFHTPDGMFVMYYDYCHGCSNLGNKRIKGRAGGTESVFVFDQGDNPDYNNTLDRGDGSSDWHHVVMTWEGAPSGTVKLYFDGVLKDMKGYQSSASAATFRIGNNYGLWQGWHDGKMDNFHLANYVMSQAQISRLFEDEKPDGSTEPEPCPPGNSCYNKFPGDKFRCDAEYNIMPNGDYVCECTFSCNITAFCDSSNCNNTQYAGYGEVCMANSDCTPGTNLLCKLAIPPLDYMLCCPYNMCALNVGDCRQNGDVEAGHVCQEGEWIPMNITVCTDPDAGSDEYWIKSRTVGPNANREDYCDVEQGNLVEWYCDTAGQVAWKTYECPDACADGACYDYEPECSLPFSYELESGWNFVSPVYVDMDGADPTYFFPNTQLFYGFDGQYVLAQTMNLGEGYWQRNSVTESIEVFGNPLPSFTFEFTEAKSYLIGAPFDMILSQYDCVEKVEHKLENVSGYYIDPVLRKGDAAFATISEPCSFTVTNPCDSGTGDTEPPVITFFGFFESGNGTGYFNWSTTDNVGIDRTELWADTHLVTTAGAQGYYQIWLVPYNLTYYLTAYDLAQNDATKGLIVPGYS